MNVVLDTLPHQPSPGSARVFVMPDDPANERPGSTSPLSRRSRVRRRTSSQRDDDSSSILSSIGDISSGQLFVKCPSLNFPSSRLPPDSQPSHTAGPLPHREYSPKRLHAPDQYADLDILADPSLASDSERARLRTRSTDGSTLRPMVGEQDRGRQTLTDVGQGGRLNKLRGLSLPRHAFRNGSLSDSSDKPRPNVSTTVPPMPTFARNRPIRHVARDSNATQQSSTSSSLYPKSSSTESSLQSPVSLSHHGHDLDDRLIIADAENDAQAQLYDMSDMDQDDVSYRLRLLMQNNYYLPPAHSKPFKDGLGGDLSKKVPPKAPSPTAFLDLFKGVGKKRGPNSTDHKTSTASPAGPMLRATNDPSTMSGLLRPANAQPRQRDEAKRGRVVVVREQMHDLEEIAWQVEQELKVREAEKRRQAGADSEGQSEKVQKDVQVDPTDFVDLPVLPADVRDFFGDKAAVLSRMPVDAFVNAALLADQLPPASPGWSNSCDDSAERESENADAIWRKAVLHAAVNHSLNNSPVNTPSRSRSGFGHLHASDTPNSPPPFSPKSPKHSSPLSPTLSLTLALAAVPEVHSEEEVSGDEKTKDGRGQRAFPLIKNVPSSKKRVVGQPISPQVIDDDELSDIKAVPPILKTKPNTAVAQPKPVQPTSTSTSTQKSKVCDLTLEMDLLRTNSPVIPTTPLSPPPRHRKTISRTESVLIATQSNEVSTGRSDQTARPGAAAAEIHVLEEADALKVQEVEVPGRLSDVFEPQIATGRSLCETMTAATSTSSTTTANLSAARNDSKVSISKTDTTSSDARYSEDESGDEMHLFHTPREMTIASSLASRPSLVSKSSFASMRSNSYQDLKLKSDGALQDVFAANVNESVYMSIETDRDRSRAVSRADTLGNGSRSRSLSLVNTLGNGARSRTTSHASTVDRNILEPKKTVVSPPPRTSSTAAAQIARRPPSPIRRTATSPLPTTSLRGNSMDDFVPGASYEDPEPETPKASSSSPTTLQLTVPRLTVNVQGGPSASPIAFFDAFEAQAFEEEQDEEDEEEEEEEEEEEDEESDDAETEHETLSDVHRHLGPSFDSSRRSDVSFSSDLVSLDPRTGSLHSVAYPHIRTHLAPFMQQRNASSPQLGYNTPPHSILQSDSMSVAESVKSGRSVGSTGSGRGFWSRFGGKGKRGGEVAGLGHGLGLGLGGDGSGCGTSLINPLPRGSFSSDRARKEPLTPTFMHAPIENLRSGSSGNEDVEAARPSTSGSVHVGTNKKLDGLLEKHMQREKEVLRRITTTHSSSGMSNS